MASGTRYRVLAAIQTYCERHGMPPTLEELREMVGVKSKTTVLHHLRMLEKLGFLERDEYKHRGISLL